MSDLNFQNFGLDDSPFTNPNSDRRNPSSVKDTANLVTGNIDLNDDTKTESKLPNAHNIFSFKYYQQFFDVDQEQVYNRLLRAVIPTPNSNFIIDHVQPLPDLYGPLWIAITFIFSTAICGNLAHYIETHGHDHYENDFGLVTGATTLVTSYVLLIPFVLYWVLWYRQAAIQYSYLELLSAYGYSLAIFVPVSILWVIHFHWFRWILILAGIGVGCFMLYNIVWPAIRNDPNRAVALGVVAGVLILHASLGLGFKAFYFDSVIPAQHGAPIEKTEPDVPGTVPEAQALVAGNLSDAEKKVTEREINFTETDPTHPNTAANVAKPADKKEVTAEKKPDVAVAPTAGDKGDIKSDAAPNTPPAGEKKDSASENRTVDKKLATATTAAAGKKTNENYSKNDTAAKKEESVKEDQ